MADIHARVERLIALALDPNANENEARTAALQACRLIHEHKLLRPSVPEKGIEFDLFADLFGPAVAARKAAEAARAAAAAASAARRQPDPRRKVTLAPSGAHCPGCRVRLPAASIAVWSHGEYWHGSCLDKELGL